MFLSRGANATHYRNNHKAELYKDLVGCDKSTLLGSTRVNIDRHTQSISIKLHISIVHTLCGLLRAWYIPHLPPKFLPGMLGNKWHSEGSLLPESNMQIGEQFSNSEYFIAFVFLPLCKMLPAFVLYLNSWHSIFHSASLLPTHSN